MPATISHALSMTTPNDPLYENQPQHWNSNHAVTLNISATEISGLFSNANGVSFGLSANSITASIAAGGAPGSISAGTTRFALGEAVFSNSNGITFGLDGATVTASLGTAGIPVHNSANHSGNIIPAAVQDFGNFAVSLGTAAPPAANATRLGFYGFNEQGKTRFGMVTPDGSNVVHAQDQFIIVRNTSGTTIDPGKACYVTGSTGQTPNISPARSDSITTMPAIGITVDSIANNAFGRLMIAGIADNLDTSAFTEGDRLWVSAVTAGDLTVTEPAYPNLRQRMAVVINAHATQGKLLITNTGARGEFGIQAISAGTTQFTSGGAVFSNSNGISFGVNGNTVTAQHNALTSQSNQALSGQNGSFTFQTASFSNANGISFGTSAGPAITASHNGITSQTNQTGAIYVTAQSTGQSSSSTYDLRTLSIVPDGIISAGWSAGSFRISATQSNQAASASNGSFTFQTLNFSNANNVTFGTSAGGIITASVAAPGGAAITQSIGISTQTDGGATAGTSGYATGDDILYHFVPGSNITMSQSLNGASATLSIYGAAGGGGGGATISAWPPLYEAVQTVVTATVNSGASGGTGGSTQWTYSGRLWPVDIPAQVNWASLYSVLGIAATSSGTGSATNQLLLGIYSLNANTALSLLTSYVWSQAMSQNSVTARSHRWGWGTNSTSNSSSLGGNVSATFTGSRMAIAHGTQETLSPGRWYFCQALLQRTSSVNVFQVASMAEQLGSASTSGYTIFGTNNLASRPGHWGGVFSTTTNTPAITVTAMPASINTSAITLTDNASRWRPVFVQMLRSNT